MFGRAVSGPEILAVPPHMAFGPPPAAITRPPAAARGPLYTHLHGMCPAASGPTPSPPTIALWTGAESARRIGVSSESTARVGFAIAQLHGFPMIRSSGSRFPLQSQAPESVAVALTHDPRQHGYRELPGLVRQREDH
jgi:hypothetical protein